MEELIKKMNELHATTFALYLKSHGFHWNVRGRMFAMYHDFFGDFYDEVYGSVDRTAEEIRALGGNPVAGLMAIRDISRVSDAPSAILSADQMISTLYYDNQLVIDCLMEAHSVAESQKAFGLINYIEERLDAHKKHAWQLSSSMDSAPVAEQVTQEAIIEESVQRPATLTEEVKTYFLNPKQ